MSKHESWKDNRMSEQGSDDIPVDEFYSDYSDGESYRTVASTVLDYQFYHGRRYHAYSAGAYPFPNDSRMNANEKISHHLWLRLFDDKLYLAPIESPKRVLDIGTGTGLWPSGMADRFEDATVVGIDLSKVEVEYLQPNLSFDVDDITREWTPRGLFDFIHLRSLFASIADWPFVYAEAFKNMESGGYIEIVDLLLTPMSNDGTMPLYSIFKRWEELGQQFNEATGKEFFNGEDAKQQMAAVGFVDIVQKVYKLPLGAWSIDAKYREIGKWYEAYWRSGMHGWITQPARMALGWSEEETNNFLRDTEKGLDNRRQHIYYNAVVLYARKP